MKKTLLIVGLVVLALGVFGVGAVLAQGQQPPFGGRGPMMGNGAGFLHTYMVDAFATKLGLKVDDVNARLTAGETMYDIALSAGVKAGDFPTVMNEVRNNAVDAAVKDGVLTQAQADWMKSRGFGRGGMMGGNGYNGNCPMFDGDENGQTRPNNGYGPGMMGGRGWQNQNP